MSESTNPWMEKLAGTLAVEGILKEPALARFVPAQFYGRTLPEFGRQLASLFRSSGWEKRRISVFVDGVSKKCSEGPRGGIDESLQDILKDLGFTFEWFDLSTVLGVAPADIHTSHIYMDPIRETLRHRKDEIIIILGSGSITDLVKHALYLEGQSSPLISIPTALTVTAFTSSFSVIDFHGAKRTQVSREVTATFWVKPFLECAPARMSQAGYGDLLARFVAYGDWYLGYRLGVMERYNERSFRLMEPFVPGIRTNAAGFVIQPLPEETTACTAAALAMAGIAMSTAGETTPLSGYEHVISHALDFLRLASGQDLVFHGEQVALGSLVSARTIDWLLELPSLPEDAWRLETVDDTFRNLADKIAAAPIGGAGKDQPEKREAARREFMAEYEKKSLRWQEAALQRRVFASDWSDIRKNLARLTLRAADTERLLKQSGLPRNPEETYPPTTAEAFRWAISFAPFVRSRMNIADLIYWLGKDPAFIWTVPGTIR